MIPGGVRSSTAGWSSPGKDKISKLPQPIVYMFAYIYGIVRYHYNHHCVYIFIYNVTIIIIIHCKVIKLYPRLTEEISHSARSVSACDLHCPDEDVGGAQESLRCLQAPGVFGRGTCGTSTNSY